MNREIPRTPFSTRLSGSARETELRLRNLFSGPKKGDQAHVGWNAVFLCTLDGEDYLLRYNPWMGQGAAGYNYYLFTLEGGGENVVQHVL